MPTPGSACGSVGRAVASKFQRSTVRIQSMAKIYIEHLLSTVLKRRKKKKRPGMAYLKNVPTPIVSILVPGLPCLFFCLLPMAKGSSNYLCYYCTSSWSGHFVNLLLGASLGFTQCDQKKSPNV